MFPNEHVYQRARRRSIAEGRRCVQADGSKRLLMVDECLDSVGTTIPGRSLYAQNETYLEFCNSGWEQQWKAGIGSFFVLLPCLLVFWGLYGFAIHPFITGNMLFLWFGAFEARSNFVWFGWLLLFPLSLGCCVLLWLWFDIMGARTCFFTYARGRIRFNRVTRKVYLLRPRGCGGNAVFDWDQGVLHSEFRGETSLVPLPRETQDRISMMYQFMNMPTHEGTFVILMSNGRKVEHYSYRLVNEVRIKTPAGEFDTFHFERVTYSPKESRAEVWLAKERDNFPVKVVFDDPKGLRLEQDLIALQTR